MSAATLRPLRPLVDAGLATSKSRPERSGPEPEVGVWPALRRDGLSLFVLAVLFAFSTPANAQGASPASGPEGAFVEVHGQRVHYLDRGRGPVVVLLHGLGADVGAWSGTVEAVAASGRRVIAIDQLGFGRSDKPQIRYRPSVYVDTVQAVLDELGVQRASLVGWSLGGAAAANFALRHPERVERLVLLSAGYGYALPSNGTTNRLGHNPGTLGLLAPATLSEARAHLVELFADDRAATDAAAADLLRRAWAHGYANQSYIQSFLRREDVLDGRLAALRVPTLVIGGEHDGIAPHALDRRLARDIPGARLVSLPVGHAAPLEAPEAFRAALLEFLSTPTGASR